ncbi:TfoX/Sxy family transcriptional regulator of competence genes [Microbacteriaceae bacterium SG_E_30_P1]|uniref:TfoX/Sxy family transcriptional regulator of competence genes n=1 Tax=Antiquaquibacter oligotrophicus TaxID=2880260 RepID=A0ABT6KN87_9MICO|nr:hypothetical protein [Antiquaquibacter oligotrophicus]MDH6181476.1 TfoX/Sxy family transcriptional regulator of competence genes [Antiquaquibacter oligotrophicus]UDF12834.1 hypothetical protein LH407_11820 [Antiquaquibacter oligotrophicus]
MKMPRPSDEAKERFRELVGDFAEASVRPMFANLGAFVNGHMFAGLLGNVVGVKLLDEDLLREARSTPGTVAFGPGGEPLREYVGFPVDWPRDELSDWLAVAYSQLRELPPKEQKKR